MGGLVSTHTHTHTHTHKVEGLPWHLWCKLASLPKIAITVVLIVPVCAHAHFLLGIFLSLHFHGERLFCFWWQVHSFSHHVHLFCLLMDSSIHRRRHTLFRRGTPIHYSHSANFLLSKSFFQHFESFCDIFHKFEESLMLTCGFFQVFHYLFTPKLQVEQHTLVLNTTFLKNHMCYCLIPWGKWLNKLYCNYTWQ